MRKIPDSLIFVQVIFPVLNTNRLRTDFCLPQADQICYAVLCVFSYVAAGDKKTRQESGHTFMSGSVSPRGPRYSSVT